MPRRPAWFASFAMFCLGVLVIAWTGSPPIALGQPKPLVVPPAPQAPTLTTPVTLGLKQGASLDLVLSGTNLDHPTGVVFSGPGKATIVPEAKDAKPNPAAVKVKFELPADAPVGMHTIRIATKQGISNFRPVLIDDLAGVEETQTNRTKDTAQDVPAPCTISGRTDAEASDFFKVKVAAGQKLTFEVLARRIGSPLDPILVLHDAKTKRELIDLYADDTPGLQSDCRLVHTFKEAGEILVEVRDTTYRGGGDFFYRLRIGDFPGAITAYPLAIQRGVEAKVGFAGPGTDDIPLAMVKAVTDPSVPAVNVAPKRSPGNFGWPLPVRVTDEPQIVEAEPNNTPDKATKLAVPGGASARFLDKGDIDHFSVAGKKGQKLVIAAQTYEVNSPAEVLVRVLDSKGAQLAASNPAAATRLEYTPAADGDFIIACEHLNYLFGPNEVYHLSVKPATPDFDVSLVLDRVEAPAGGGTAVAVANVARLNGYAGPVELSIAGDPALSGTITVPAGQMQTFVPLMVKAGTKPGPHRFHVKATAKVDGKDVVRFANLTDAVKANLGGIPNPPPELLTECAMAVVEKPSFALKYTLDPAAGIEKGKTGKLIVDATREKEADGDIVLAPLFTAPNIAPAVKPVPKGQTKAEVGITVAPPAAVGPAPVVIRATTKIGGKDYVVTPPPAIIDVVEPKKVEPKKTEPKKEEPKKK